MSMDPFNTLFKENTQNKMIILPKIDYDHFSVNNFAKNTQNRTRIFFVPLKDV